MAVVENRFVCDLKRPVQAQALKGNVFSLDNLGSRLSVLIYDNGQPATISGSITANCILPDGSTVNVNGGLTTENGGSKAYVDIPQSCLLISGILKIAIKCTSSSVVTTLAAIVANVYMTKTDNVITPSQQIIDDWNAEISAAIATIGTVPTGKTVVGLIDEEATLRADADNNLLSAVQTEATARTNADNGLKSAIGDISNYYVGNLYDGEWENGDINSSSGIPVPDDRVIRTKDYCEVAPELSTMLYSDREVNGYLGAIYQYSAQRTDSFIGYSIVYNGVAINLNSNCKYIKVVLASAYGTTFNNDVNVLQRNGLIILRKKISETVEQAFFTITNLFDKTASGNVNGKILQKSGNSYTEVTINNFGYSHYIPVEAGGVYTFLSNAELGATSGALRVFAFNANYEYINTIDGVFDSETSLTTITNNLTGAAYLRINYYDPDVDKLMFVKGNEYPESYANFGRSIALSDSIRSAGHKISDAVAGVYDVMSIAKNLFNIDSSGNTEGKILAVSGGSIVEITTAGYGYTEAIPVSVGTRLSIKTYSSLGAGQYRYFMFDDNGTAIAAGEAVADLNDSSVGHLTVSNPSAVSVKFNYELSDDEFMVILGDEYPATFHPYNQLAVLKQIPANYSIGNVLYGKKLAVVGDSYTEARFTGDYAEYNGKNYGWYISQRNNMEFYSDGIGGSTMAVSDPENPSVRSPFALQRYLNVPADTDYLVIWFGINDSAYSTLGTINDTEITTFYGAWNFVLKYFLTNYPFMKILVIVTVATDDPAFQPAVRAVCEKWGYPYLDWEKDPTIPALFDKEGMESEAQTLRRAAFGWNGPVPGHPNPRLHEYESTVIESFLRRI